jgi:hypothetical protein
MILKAHRDATKLVIAGMAALRVTPQSRTRPGQAATAHAAGPGAPKPWSWRAEIVDPGVGDSAAEAATPPPTIGDDDGDAPA